VPRGLLAYWQDRGGRQQDLPDREPCAVWLALRPPSGRQACRCC